MMKREEVYFNPWDEPFRADPYPYYRQLLQGPPRLVKAFVPMALVSRYADVVAVLRDHERFSSVPRHSALMEKAFGDVRHLVFSDPPEHTCLRASISHKLTPLQIHEMEPKIREFTNVLLDKVAHERVIDVIRDLAEPLPVVLISQILGIPIDRYAAMKSSPGWQLCFPTGAAKLAALDGSKTDVPETFLSREELIALVGSEATTNLIGNGMLALMRNPDQLERLRHEPGLLSTAIEEILRYDSPVQAVVRHLRQDVEIAGTRIPKRSLVFTIIAAANRDPAQFKEPGKLDFGRQPNRHLAFGWAAHSCPGQRLARMEASIALSILLERFPRLRLLNPQTTPIYKSSYFIRGLASLPLEVGHVCGNIREKISVGC